MELRIDNLSLKLRGRDVLRDISARFTPGKITVILGPNGAGKSSLLSCLTGLQRQQHGRITLAGASIFDLPAALRARHIGLLAQKADIHWDIDVRALIALGRLPHHGRWGRSAADEAAIDAAMAHTDCTALAGRRAQQLSGGEQARVLLARALAGQPDWLLADEPLANFDPVHQLDVMSCLRAVADGGMGIVLVLHDLTQAARIADQIIILDKGEVAASGSVSEVLTPELLARIFSIRVHVGTAACGMPIITPMARAA
ncbi:ABC transporter ATP-binding protein [Aquisediminimonas sediminicola]|uniref:ABC transporter ATP-binding protein n=1 Tax=Alteraquisediminimonas sediminicola TaxID=2676787 RepID=UPI001C8ED754|nr:ABC transporter ATP-binding protein [Aquisediminimonas sediminicola]